MHSKTALIVDDEATIRLYIKTVLQQLGFETLEAADGLQALQLLRNDAAGVNLLLSDIRMPRMDGIALARAIRAEFPAIPVILISGYCSGDEEPDLDVQFIPKPFTPATLLTAIDCAMTEKKKPRSETEPQTSRNRKAGG
jgi:two-component system cell cycle sensor histidine kinase/response regulator CckA